MAGTGVSVLRRSEVGRALIAFMLVVLGFLSILGGLILDLLLRVEKELLKRR